MAFQRSNLRTKVGAGMKENHRMNNATRSFVFFSCPRESPDQPKGPLRMIFRLFVTSNDPEAARNKGGARFESVKGAFRLCFWVCEEAWGPFPALREAPRASTKSSKSSRAAQRTPARLKELSPRKLHAPLQSPQGSLDSKPSLANEKPPSSTPQKAHR